MKAGAVPLLEVFGDKIHLEVPIFQRQYVWNRERHWEPLILEMEEPPRDPKTTLQEWAQARGLALPAYELLGTNGPDHALRFTVSARVTGFEEVSATASSKRAAEAGAAAALLERVTSSKSD